MVKIYADDLNDEHKNDGFMGEGFEDALKLARLQGKNIIVGEYYDTWRVEE